MNKLSTQYQRIFNNFKNKSDNYVEIIFQNLSLLFYINLVAKYIFKNDLKIFIAI